MRAAHTPIREASRSAPRVFSLVLELATAAAAAGGAVLLASSRLVEAAKAEELLVLRLVSVFSVVLAGLMVHRWATERRVRSELAGARQTADEDLNRMKDQFIANVSHGLRTPLTGIVGFSHLLRESVRGSEARESVNMILGEAAELSRIIDDLLMAARLDADVLEIQVESVPLIPEVEEVISFMDLLGVRVAVDCDDAHVRVNPETFRQVLRNLLVNAHRHGRPQVTVRGRVQHGRYVCHVIDQGSGVSAEVQEQLFQRFAYRPTEGVSGYVGLGLSIVQELCRRMGAEVAYRRIRGETHFVISLPLSSDPNHRPITDVMSRRRLVHTPEQAVRVGDRLVRIPG